MKNGFTILINIYIFSYILHYKTYHRFVSKAMGNKALIVVCIYTKYPFFSAFKPYFNEILTIVANY